MSVFFSCTGLGYVFLESVSEHSKLHPGFTFSLPDIFLQMVWKQKKTQRSMILILAERDNGASCGQQTSDIYKHRTYKNRGSFFFAVMPVPCTRTFKYTNTSLKSADLIRVGEKGDTFKPDTRKYSFLFV